MVCLWCSSEAIGADLQEQIRASGLARSKAANSRLNQARRQQAFKVMEDLKAKLLTADKEEKGRDDKVEMATTDLLQYIITGRSGGHSGSGLSSIKRADIYQKTLMTEAIILASLFPYQDKEDFKSFVNNVVVPALNPKNTLLSRNHAALVCLLYFKAQSEEAYDKVLKWYMATYSTPGKKQEDVEKFLNTFRDAKDRSIDFKSLQESIKVVREKVSPEKKKKETPAALAGASPVPLTKQMLQLRRDAIDEAQAHSIPGNNAQILIAAVEKDRKKFEDAIIAQEEAENRKLLELKKQEQQRADADAREQKKNEEIGNYWKGVNNLAVLRNTLTHHHRGKVIQLTGGISVKSFLGLEDFRYTIEAPGRDGIRIKKLSIVQQGLMNNKFAIEDINIKFNHPVIHNMIQKYAHKNLVLLYIQNTINKDNKTFLILNDNVKGITLLSGDEKEARILTDEFIKKLQAVLKQSSSP